MAHSPLEKLIKIENSGDSDARRSILRDVTDAFMVAPDRYGRREMAYFDLLFTRNANMLDKHIRKVVVMTLVRAGSKPEDLRHTLNSAIPPMSKILRRSVTQTSRDLVALMSDYVGKDYFSEDLDFSDGNSLTLSSGHMHALFDFIATSYFTVLAPRIDRQRMAVVRRTVVKIKTAVINKASEQARDEIVVARRTVRDWARRHAISDTLLGELIEARAMTEVIFTLTVLFDLDASTTIRLLNDGSYESLAIASKASRVRRAVFAKTIMGFNQRATDREPAERVLNLYDKLSVESAERAMRFWRVRAAELGGVLGDEAELGSHQVVA